MTNTERLRQKGVKFSVRLKVCDMRGVEFHEMKYIKWWGNLAVTLVFIKGDLT